ncbi:hypothetical protein PF003_g6058 [Phytophthora fragariae]|nr:hypothetical protein PF003_g6058 [Phytophthora fragariae]
MPTSVTRLREAVRASQQWRARGELANEPMCVSATNGQSMLRREPTSELQRPGRPVAPPRRSLSQRAKSDIVDPSKALVHLLGGGDVAMVGIVRRGAAVFVGC